MSKQKQSEFEKSAEELFKPYDVKSVNKVGTEFLERVILLIVAGLGLITALAWDTVLKDIFNLIFGDLGSLYQKIAYALLLTLITTIVTMRLSKLMKKKGK